LITADTPPDCAYNALRSGERLAVPLRAAVLGAVVAEDVRIMTAAAYRRRAVTWIEPTLQRVRCVRECAPTNSNTSAAADQSAAKHR
jgi:hypothetical protein